MAKKAKSIPERAKEALERVCKLATSGLNFIEASNALYGPGGLLTTLFPTPAERTAFSQSKQAKQINELLERLPMPAARHEKQRSPADVNGTIILRVPKSLHAALFAEAEAEGVSLNQLCVAKLSAQLQAMV